jgi:hypothetical protein
LVKLARIDGSSSRTGKVDEEEVELVEGMTDRRCLRLVGALGISCRPLSQRMMVVVVVVV